MPPTTNLANNSDGVCN